MQVTTEIQQRVNAKIQEGIAIAKAAYNVDVQMPKIVYDKRGTTAGTANYKTWTLNFNAVLLAENVEAFIARTVPHELAHLVNDLVYPEAHATEIKWTGRGYKRTKRDVHGETWQSIMRTLGASPKRCHNYDVSNVKVEKVLTKYQYRCSCCNSIVEAGPKVHAKIQRGATYNHNGCGRGSKLVYVGQLLKSNITQKPVTLAPKTVTPPTPKVNVGGGSKLDRCKSLYALHSATKSRKEMIDLFVSLCDCTPLGASTYYATCKKG